MSLSLFFYYLQPATSQNEIEDMTEWETYYRCQLVPAGVAFLASLVITPLALIKGRRHSDCAWFLRIRSTRICRPGMLFLVMCVYFLYYLGNRFFFNQLHIKTFSLSSFFNKRNNTKQYYTMQNPQWSPKTIQSDDY